MTFLVALSSVGFHFILWFTWRFFNNYNQSNIFVTVTFMIDSGISLETQIPLPKNQKEKKKKKMVILPFP